MIVFVLSAMLCFDLICGKLRPVCGDYGGGGGG
jgi:hypothetical protein